MASNDKRTLINRLSGTAGKGAGANTGLGTADVLIPDFPKLPSRLTEDTVRQFRQDVDRWRVNLQGQFPIPLPDAFDPSGLQSQIDSAVSSISSLQAEVDALPAEIASGLQDTITSITNNYLTEIRNQLEIIRQQIINQSTQFIFTQDTPSQLWNVVHGLGGYPSVTVTDSAGNVGYGAVQYQSTSALTVAFASSFSGKAYLVL
jgi:hypothetical protein